MIKHFYGLLDQGVDVDVIKKSEWSMNITALSFAISGGKTQTVKLLIKRGADVNWKLLNGFSQLMLASRLQHHRGGRIVEILLDNGADMKDVEARGLTPLMMACFFGNSDIASILIQRGSDVSSRDKSGYSALWYAAYNKKKRLMNILLRGGMEINIRDNCGRTVLMMSAASGNLSAIIRSWL
jgi:ankyrin repeat protein